MLTLPQVFFVEAGAIWQVTNTHPSHVYRQVSFALKQPPRHSEEETRRILDAAQYTTNVGTALLFENRCNQLLRLKAGTRRRPPCAYSLHCAAVSTPCCAIRPFEPLRVDRLPRVGLLP